MNLCYSACLELLFKEEQHFEDRLFRAKDAGFAAVEFWMWRNKDLQKLEAALEKTDLLLTGFVAEPMLPLTDSQQHSRFIDGLKESIEVARRLGCDQLIAQAGNEILGVARKEQHEAIVSALKQAAPILEDSGVTLLLEPLNTLVDHPGYYLHQTREGLDIIEEVNSKSVLLLYDIYHSVVMGEEPSRVLDGFVPLVGHVHLADVPGRHEPGSGSMDWKAQLAWLEDNGYCGYVGLEYTPTTTTIESLNWLDI